MKPLAVLLFLASAVFAAQQKNPLRVRPAGGRYRTCHVSGSLLALPWLQGQGDLGPDLTLGTFSAGEQDSDLCWGHFRGCGRDFEMTGYGESMGAGPYLALVSYIRTISQHTSTPSPGDPAAGETVLEKGRGGADVINGLTTRPSGSQPDAQVGAPAESGLSAGSVVAPNART